ncbi:MAG: twin-arginine translocase TatA/TatE family subunit [Myxococcota bacterium]
MPNLGMGELLIILVIVLLIFGASRLPQIGEALGKSVKGLKRGLATDDDIDVTPKDKQVPDKSSAETVPAAADVAEAEIVKEKS